MGIGLKPTCRSHSALCCQHLGMLTSCLLGNGKLTIYHVSTKGSAAHIDERSHGRHGITPLPYRLTLTLFYLHFFFPF